MSVLWEAGLKDATSVSREQRRHIQDCIYVLRSKGPLVPDQWYTWLRDGYQVDMKSAVAELKPRAEQALADSSQRYDTIAGQPVAGGYRACPR